MRKLIFICSLFIMVGLVSAKTLLGQQAQDTEGSLLPDIDPQDIEIRSQYRARFPGLRRQPILGFRPGSRVYQVDPDRTPFMEELENIAAQLPVGELSRPEEPEHSFFPYASSATGYGRIGVGNFIASEAEIYLENELAENQWISGSLNHSAANSHLEQASSFRYLNLESNYRGKIGDRTILGASFGVDSDFNYLPELESNFQNLTGGPGRKEYRHVAGGMRLQQYRSTIEHLDIGINAYYSSIDLDDLPEELDSGITTHLPDWGVTADAGYTWAGERIQETFSLNTHLQAGGYEWAGGESDSWSTAGAGATYKRLFDYRTKLDATLGVYHISNAMEQSKFFVAPEISAEYYLSEHLTFAGNLTGRPGHPGHFDLHRENRFLLPQNRLRHSYDLKVTGEVIAELLPYNKLRAGISYQSSRNYPFYMRTDLAVGPEVLTGYYNIEYGNATIPKAYAGIGVDLIPERLWFDIEGYVQNPRLSADREIPFQEKYGLHGAVTIRPVDRLLFEAWGTFTGPRQTGYDETLDPYLNLGSRLELRISQRVGVYGKIQNLLNQNYEIWEGFRERPFQVYGGITIIL